jgi:signal peptidase I
MNKAALWALIAGIIVKLILFDFIIAQGESMTPAIKSGSVLVVSRLRYGLRLPGPSGMQRYLVHWSSPKKGEVLVFYTPLGELAVKRCAGLFGKENFIAEGDNNLQSYDSRSYGPVPLDNIIGKVLGY